jgi:ribulose-phosphate 3-epimerase
MDVMDGHFVPNITFGPQLVASVSKETRLPLDVHLMIEQPDRYLEAFVEAGAQLLSIHAEACPHLHRTVQVIRSLGARPGVVLNPSTPLSVLDYILEDVDLILIMTVNPGFGGQAFIPAMIPKIAALRRTLDERRLEAELEVDGGITLDNVRQIAKAGATAFVSGSGILGNPDYASVISRMRDEVRRTRAEGDRHEEGRLSTAGR